MSGFELSDPFGVVGDVFGGITGSDAADAAEDAARLQAASAGEAIEFQRESRDLARADLAPFLQFGADIIPQANQLLFDPMAHATFLRNNPLFQQAADTASNRVLNLASARGRATAGDTGQAILESNLLAGLPLLQGQQQNLWNALQLGQSAGAGTAAGTLQTGNVISDLITGRGSALAAGEIGAANARQQGINNLLNIGMSAGALALSDRRAKRNITQTGEKYKGAPVYQWQYHDDDQWYMGLMSDDAARINPDSVITLNGVDVVNYGVL